MLAALSELREWFSSHWSIVLGVSLAFLIVQLLLSVRVYLRARRHERILARLVRHVEDGGDGRPGSVPRSFTWLRWVVSLFPRGDAAAAGNFSRDEVLRELDTRIAGYSDYLLLQRMGVMAPLLGVVLTVVGFYWLNVDESGEQSLESILLAVTPLVSGVGAGAVLALINQILLHAVGSRLERLRMSARNWFDQAIWSTTNLQSQTGGGKMAASVERFAETAAASADRHLASAERIADTTASIKHAASELHDVVHAFSSEIKGIPESLRGLRESTFASAEALQELVPAATRSVANLDVSVAAFRTTIDREFTDAAKLHYRSSKGVAELVDQLSVAGEALQSSAQALTAQMTEFANAMNAHSDQLREILERNAAADSSSSAPDGGRPVRAGRPR
jgi:uncharacterized protein YukE